MATCSIDWLTFTTRHLNEKPELFGGDVFFSFDSEPIRPVLPNYQRGHLSPIGVNLMHGVQGSALSFTGRVLQRMRENGFDEVNMINYLTANEWGVSRVDIAIDIITTRRVVELYDAWNSGKVKLWTAIAGFHHSVEKGLSAGTMTAGRRGSQRYMRVYEKGRKAAQELGSRPTPWVRIEFELKGRAAKMALLDITRNGVESAARNTYDRMVIGKTGVNWIDSQVEKLESGSPPLVADTSGGESERWLRDVALRKVIERCKDNEFFGYEVLMMMSNAMPDFAEIAEKVIDINGEKA